jgi:hypothetical protein
MSRMSYAQHLRSLPLDSAQTLLDALLDHAWATGAQAALHERDAVQAAYFERHVNEMRREATATREALVALEGSK